ncbi:hypothetical protein LguiB_027033 [Lonicera macranthoides]
MDHIAAAEERIVTERMKQKLNQVNTAAQSHLAPLQDHVNFTLQQAYFKCAYECFDRRRRQEEIGMCVENCSVPALTAQNLVQNEMSKFQIDLDMLLYISDQNGSYSGWDTVPSPIPDAVEERLNRTLMVCQDKFESAKLQHIKTDTAKDLESCVNQSVEDSIKTLPHLVGRLKASLSIND